MTDFGNFYKYIQYYLIIVQENFEFLNGYRVMFFQLKCRIIHELFLQPSSVFFFYLREIF